MAIMYETGPHLPVISPSVISRQRAYASSSAHLPAALQFSFSS